MVVGVPSRRCWGGGGGGIDSSGSEAEPDRFTRAETAASRSISGGRELPAVVDGGSRALEGSAGASPAHGCQTRGCGASGTSEERRRGELTAVGGLNTRPNMYWSGSLLLELGPPAATFLRLAASLNGSAFSAALRDVKRG